MILMVSKQGFLQKWFPTFVGLFTQFKPTEKEETALFSREIPQKSVRDAPFFLQGLNDDNVTDLLSRDKLLESLAWVTFNPATRPHTPITEQAEVTFPEHELVPMLREPVAIATVSPVQEVLVEAQDSELDTNFFIRGLRTTEALENIKNTDLLALLTWEEQGQTLLEVDPDDYELLDDLLDAVDV